MADSEAITSLIKDLEEMKDGLGSLSDLMEGTQEVSDSLLQSFQSFATTGSSATLWGAVSRFSSGIFPGFWSLQNKVRAVAVYMQYVEKKQKEQIQAEGKIAKTIRNQSKVRNEAFRVFEILQKDNLSIIEEMTLEQDAYYSVLKAQLGAEEAKLKYQKAYQSTLVENIDSELKLSRAVGERIRNEEKYADFFEMVSATNVKSLEKVLYFKEQEEEAEKRLTYFSEERGKLQEEALMTQFALIDLDRNSVAYDSEREKLNKMNQKIEELDAQIEKQTLARDSAAGARKIVSEEEGVSIFDSGGETGISEKDNTKSRDEMIKGITQYVTKYIKTFPLIAKTIMMWKWLGLKNNRKLLLGFAQMGLHFMKKMMLGFLGIGLLVFAIHQSGIVGRIVEFIEYAKGSKLFKIIMGFVTVTLSGLYDIFDGIFTFFYGLFTGDTGKVVEGLKTFGFGAIKLIGGFIMTMTTSILLGLPGLLTHVAILAVEMIIDFGVKMFSSAKNFAKGAGTLAGAAKGAAIGSVGGPMGIIAGGLIGGGLGYLGGSGVGSLLGGKAGGGRVNRSGSYLVGEAGPEILSLPSNSFITPTIQSRAAMGNNITVQVNGRVGASDSELNEIARKIGQKINRQMNQYGSAGYRA